MVQDTDHYSYLICPFTGRKLRFLSAQELETVNNRIDLGELYFHPGIQVKNKLAQALVSEHQTYIYPIEDNIFFLKKETAIVAKNRTENYLKRINQSVIDQFESTYSFDVPSTDQVASKATLSSDLVGELKSKLPKVGKHFLSMCNGDVDAIHNLIFNTTFEQYIHVEFDLVSLKKVAPELKENTVLILADYATLPFIESSIDALVSFDPINQYDKADQKLIYDDFKRALKGNAQSVIIYDDSKPLHTKILLGADKLSKTARGVLMPWKKSNLPTFHFHGVKTENNAGRASQIVGKGSLNQQFS